MVQFRPNSNGQEHRGDERAGFPGRLVTVVDPTGTASEAYRTLRTNLIYAVVDAPPEVILITSPGLAEGKTTTCANLGVVLAQAGKNTLIVDGDLRRPSIHKAFGVRNTYGLVNVLSGERDLSEVLNEPLSGLKVLSAGPIPPNPAEILGSGRFAELINQARNLFDYVIIDSPPTESVPDPVIIATQADGVLIVLDSRGTRKESLRRAMRGLEAVGANILGTVMNNVEKTKSDRYYDHYHA